MTTLRFTGARRQAFTIRGTSTGEVYYVNPGAIGGSVVDFDPEDAKALVERDPALWERVKGVAPAEVASVDDEPAPRGGRGKKE